jgi:DNA polymerase (family 10)
VVVAIHSHFDLSEAKQTARVLRAFDVARIDSGASDRPADRRSVPLRNRSREGSGRGTCEPCYIGQCPAARLDIDDVTCKAAREHGVLVSIASDAHAGAELADLQNGVRQARRGWLSRADVLNARPLAQVRRLLARTRL